MSPQVGGPAADGPLVPHLVFDRAALHRVRVWGTGSLLVLGVYAGLLAGRSPAYPWPIAAVLVLVLTTAAAAELSFPSPRPGADQAYWTQRSGWVKP